LESVLALRLGKVIVADGGSESRLEAAALDEEALEVAADELAPVFIGGGSDDPPPPPQAVTVRAKVTDSNNP
jgi:hypothetical protein